MCDLTARIADTAALISLGVVVPIARMSQLRCTPASLEVGVAGDFDRFCNNRLAVRGLFAFERRRPD